MASSSGEVASGPDQKRLDSKELPSICSLGKGLSGFIYETKWKGIKYARKDFPLGSEECNSVFEDEIKSLFALDDPNIVKCFGYTVGDSSCSLLLEYVDSNLQNTIQRSIEARRNKNSTDSRGTLRLRIVDVDEVKGFLSSIEKNRKITRVDEGTSKTLGRSNIPFEVPEAVNIISQIVAGMKYLHDNRVVHGDLKPKNVLSYSESGSVRVKLADFGLVETKKRIKLVSKRTQHFEILMWKAPEQFEELLGPLAKEIDDPFTDSDTDDEDVRFVGHGDDKFKILAMSDVYSFGLICSHILGGKLLCSNLSLTQLREQRMHIGFKPEMMSATCPDFLRGLIYSCLDFHPLSRPTFFDISSAFFKALHPLPLRQLMEGRVRKGGSQMDPVTSMFFVINAVTELIKVVMQCTQAAVKCKTECQRLYEELDVIKPDVERIEKRLASLPKANYSDAHDDLQMVEAWLTRLKSAIEAAKVDVDRCNSGRRISLDQLKLSVRLTSHYNSITNIGNQRVQMFLLLGSRMHVPSHGTQHPPQNSWFENPGESVLGMMADERNDALRREDLFRQSITPVYPPVYMPPGSSAHSSGWGYEFGGYDCQWSETSSQGGYRSEADSSGYGWDRPRAHLLRHETERRDVFLQGEEQVEADLRRHMAAGMASAYGHEPAPPAPGYSPPAPTNWKY